MNKYWVYILCRMEQQSGFGFVELLIAIFILTFYLLGISGVSVAAWQRSERAYWNTLAISHLVNLVEAQKVDLGDIGRVLIAGSELLPSGKDSKITHGIQTCWHAHSHKYCYKLETKT